MWQDRNSVNIRFLLASLLIVRAVGVQANWAWPPALYFGGATLWWAVPAGLAAEWILLFPFLHKSPREVSKIVLMSNAASAIVGLITLWPVVYWDRGISTLARSQEIFLISFPSILLLIVVINVAIEYGVSARWLGVSRKGYALLGYVLANVASFLILMYAGIKLWLG